jgi:hypothetical protein
MATVQELPPQPSLIEALMLSLDNASQRGHLAKELVGEEYAAIVAEVEEIIRQLQGVIASDGWNGLRVIPCDGS